MSEFNCNPTFETEAEKTAAIKALRAFADDFKNDLDSEFLGADVRRHALAKADRIKRGEP